MRTRKLILKLGAAALTYAALALTANPAFAIKYWLRADAGVISMPDPSGAGTVSVPMWGYALCGTTGDSVTVPPDPCAGAVTFPGPALAVPQGESLIVNLSNALPVPTSLVINGLIKTMVPVWTDGTTGARSSLSQRVRSFDAEAGPNGGAAEYTWTNVPPGTYLYQSGTNPQVQVQMGLYGAVTKNAADVTSTTRAKVYAGDDSVYGYDSQALLLYSEIDPALHDAVAGVKGASYGPAGSITSTLDYAPKYFLINGRPAAAGAPIVLPAAAAGTTLLRMLNAGLTTHVPMILGTHWDVIAEDGKPYTFTTPINNTRVSAPYKRNQYTVLLPAAKTSDVLLTTTSGVSYAVMDRRLSLSNDGVSGGGMMAFVGTGTVAGGGTGNSGSPANEAPVAVADPSTENAYLYRTAKGVTLKVPASGVLANDTDANVGQTIKAVSSSGPTSGGGTYTLSANGSFTYVPPASLPAANQSSGTDSFTYKATDGTVESNLATVTLTVVEPSAPTLALLDNFDRADSTLTGLGADWSQVAGTITGPDLRITSNMATAGPSTTSGQAIWNQSFGPVQGAAFTRASFANNSALILKATGGNSAATPANAIRVRYEVGTPNKISVMTLLGGSNSTTYVLQASFNATATGGTLSAVVDAKGLVLVFIGAAFQGGVQLPNVGVWKGGGRIGIQLPTAGAAVDDFSGGDLVQP